MKLQPEFLKDVARHEMQILRDDGLPGLDAPVFWRVGEATVRVAIQDVRRFKRLYGDDLPVKLANP